MKLNIKVRIDVDTTLDDEEDVKAELMHAIQELQIESMTIEAVWADSPATQSLVEAIARSKSN